MTDHYVTAQRTATGAWCATLYRPAFTGASVYLSVARKTVPDAAWVLDAEAWLNDLGFTVAAWRYRFDGEMLATLEEITS